MVRFDGTSYFSKIKDCRVFTREEEQYLARLRNSYGRRAERLQDLLDNGDGLLEGGLNGGLLRADITDLREMEKKVGDYFIINNFPLVVTRASFYSQKYPDLDFDDLIGEFQKRLVQCAAKWDPERGFKFSTYFCGAVRREFGRIRRAIAGNFETREFYKGISNGRGPRFVGSLDRERGDEGNSIYGFFEGEEELDSEVERRERVELLKRIFDEVFGNGEADEMDRRCRIALEHKYGINGREHKKLEDIAKLFHHLPMKKIFRGKIVMVQKRGHICKERVRQYQDKGEEMVIRHIEEDYPDLVDGLF